MKVIAGGMRIAIRIGWEGDGMDGRGCVRGGLLYD